MLPTRLDWAAARAAQQAAGDSTVILFGSRARGDHKPKSDVDLLLVYRGEPIVALLPGESSDPQLL